MQHPVGYRIDPDTGRAELTDIVAVLTNKVALITVPHTVAGCFLVAGGLVAAVAVWHLVRRPGHDTAAYRSAGRIGAWTVLVAMGAMLITGDIQGKIMTEVQPMKMAAAEALYESEQPAPFSVFTVGTLDGSRPVWSVEIPGLLSFLGTGSFDGRVEGVNDLQAQYEQQYGPGGYKPNIPLTYWTFRVMIGLGALAALLALWVLWATRRGRTPTSPWSARALPLLPLLPLAANSTGWIFTETGRQPWVVFGQMKTAVAASPHVGTGELVTSLLVFTLLYGVLAVIEVRLLLHHARAGLPDVTPPSPAESAEDRPLAFAY
jgi:cytochrome d ubiquinol oxidase subunit I